MKKTRFTAILLCITTLFALFTGGVYAEDGIVYIDDTTLVIEDGKVISGDKSLVESGLVVIGDGNTSDNDNNGYTAPDYGAGEVTPPAENTEEGYDRLPDAPVQNDKAPVKDNSSLVKPAPEAPVTPPSAPEEVLPMDTPTAVNPNVPQEGALSANYVNYPSLGADQDDWFTMTMYYDYYYIYQSQKVKKTNVTVSELTYKTSTLTTVFYRLKDAHSSGGPSGTGTFSGIMFDVEANKTFNLTGNADHRLYVDGRLCSSNSSGSFLPSSPTAVSRTSPRVSSPLVRVSGTGAKLNLSYVTLRYSNTSCDGAGAYIGNGGTLKMTNCTINECATTKNGGGIYIAAGGSLDMSTVTITNCSAASGGAIYVAGSATIKMSDVKIGGSGEADGNSADYGAGVYIAAGSFTLPSGCYINDNSASGHGGGVYVGGGTFTLSGGTVGYNFANHGGGVFVESGTFNMTSGNVRDNKANKSDDSTGGGIRSTNKNSSTDIVYSGNINISGGSIFNNTSIANGGGMWIGTIKSFNLTGGEIYSNTSSNRGGAMFFNRPTETPIKINGNSAVVNIYSNTAAVSGGGIVFGNYWGAIEAEIGTLNPTNRVTIRNNTATSGVGGGIHMMDDEAGEIKVTIKHADIYANSAKTYGGGICVDSEGVLTMESGRIGYTGVSYANTANKGAGLSVLNGGSFSMTGASILYNKATQYGGGLYSEGQTTINVTGGEIGWNEAVNGGGVYICGTNANGVRIVGEDNSVKIHDNKATDNSNGGGGGICLSNDDRVEGQPYPVTGVVIGGGSKPVSIYKNSAIYGGGLRFLNSGYGAMAAEIKSNTVIYENTANASETATYKGGGGIFVGGNSTLTIDGADIYSNISKFYGAGMVIAGGDVIFKSGNIRNHTVIHYGAGIEMAIRGSLTMEGGTIKENSASDGAGIHIADACTASISGGEISGNTSTERGGGIAQGGGSVTVSGDATIKSNSSHYGGGVYTNGGTLTVSGGSITENTASYGAGIHIDENTDKEKTVVVNGGSISDNNAKTNGGGIWAGVFNSFTLDGATISGNTADETNATNGYGGGLYINRGAAAGTLTLISGTISGNSASYNGGGIYFGNGTDGVTALYATLGSATANTNARAGSALNINGNSAPIGGGICIDDGSEPHQPVQITIYDGVDIYENHATVSGGGIYGSPSAVILMNGGKIRDNDVTNHENTVEIGGGGIHIYKSTLTITGGEITGNEVINNNQKTRGLGGGIYAQDLVTISIKGTADSPVVLSNNTANYRGGGLYITDFNPSTTPIFEIDHVTINGNTSKHDRGGGIFTDFEKASGERTVSITNCHVEGNTSEVYDANDDSAQGHGGGIYLAEGTYTIANIDFVDNHTTTQGAGLYCSKFATVTVSDCTFTGNESKGTALSGDNRISTGSGGGMAVYSGAVVSLTNCTFDGNTATTDGGAIGLNGNTSSGNNNISSLTLTNVTIGEGSPNTALGNGGGINQGNLSTLTVSNCTVNNNTATGTLSEGGGICVNSDTARVAISNTTISDNTASGCGGGLYIRAAKGISADAVTLTALTVTGNTAKGGGGIMLDSCVVSMPGTAESNTTINNNTTSAGDTTGALAGGGGVYSYNATLNMLYGAISNNDSSANNSAGGGVCTYGGNINLENVLIQSNKTTTNYGGGIYAGAYSGTGGKINLTNCALNSNASKYGGGAFIVSGSSITVTGGTVTGNTAEEAGGIIVYDNATGTLSNATVSGNSTTNGDGGGVMAASNSTITATNCFIINNTANGSYTGDTAKVEEHALVGAGGGVAVFDNSSFSLTISAGGAGAIYGNLASTACDDVFANGNGTKLNLPAASVMDKTYTEAKDGLWMEDYLKNDKNYVSYGLNGNSKIIMRYRETPVSIRAFTSDTEGTSPSGEYINDSGEFVAITFGVPKYNVGSIKVTAPESDDPNQRFVFSLNGTNALGETITLSVSLLGGESVTITNLISGTYTVTQHDDWSWRYEFRTVKVDENDAISTNNAEVTITGTELNELHTVVYGNEKTNFKWLSHNSVGKINVAASTNVAASFFAEEVKRSYVM